MYTRGIITMKEIFMNKYNINEIIMCKVISIKKYGVFVSIDNEYTGLIHISQINGKYISDIGKYFKENQIIKARIIGIDTSKKQLKLSTINISNRTNTNTLLTETNLGFELFDEILQDWIDEKLQEIEKNK